MCVICTTGAAVGFSWDMGSLAASLIQAVSRQPCNILSDWLQEYLLVRMIPISLYSIC